MNYTMAHSYHANLSILSSHTLVLLWLSCSHTHFNILLNCLLTVRLTREAVLDSHFLVLASNLGSQQAQQLQTHLVTFDRDTFVQKLVSDL